MVMYGSYYSLYRIPDSIVVLFCCLSMTPNGSINFGILYSLHMIPDSNINYTILFYIIVYI